MKRKWCMLTAIVVIAMAAGFLVAPNSAVADTSQNQTWLPDSLHWTLRGMEYWYGGDGDTFDSLEDTTGIPYSAFDDAASGCMNCHPKDADYPTDATVACGDVRCHGEDAPTGAPNWGTVYQMQMTAGQGCLKCHGREGAMMAKDDLEGKTDVHRDGVGNDRDYCTACHTTREMHDIGDPYYSLKEPGAMDTTCDTCHGGSGPGTTPPSSYSHDTHTDSLHCTACHQRRVTSCYNCHVDTAYASGVRQAKGQLTDWLFLMNYDGKVHSANMQTFVGGDNELVWPGDSNHINEGYEEVALMFAPVHSHSIMKPGRACADCHATDIVEEIYDYGDIAITWLDGGALEHLEGVIPVVADTTYNLVAFDKPNDVTSGFTWTPLGTSPYLYGPDDQYEIADGSALTLTQLARLNYAATGDFQEFEDGIHNTYRGMSYWYEEVSGNTLSDIVGVDYDDFDHAYQGCKNCHGAGGTGELPWPMNCDTCHGVANPTGPPWTSDPDEIEPTCLRCHARESAMKASDDAAGTPDVHRAKGMSCMECHSSREVHNIGLEYDSHKDIGAMDTKCADCHTTGPGTPQPGDYAHSVHTATVDCSACHQRRVISCYNCHMDTAKDGPMRMARTQIKDWLFLMNYDGKVHSANMQSFVGGDNSVTGGPNEEWTTYDGTALMFAPMYSHSTMKEGRTCTDCHNTATVQDIRADGELDLTWLDGSTIKNPSGVIPVGAVTDYNLLWYDKDNTVTSSPTWWIKSGGSQPADLDLKICNGEGMTVGQMGKLDNSNFNAFGHTAHINGAKGPKVASCTTCHLSATPVKGDAPLWDTQTLANTAVCDDCHSPSGAYDGVDDATTGCKANWLTGVYEADGKTLQSGKELWCAGCHDDMPASSMAAASVEVIVDNEDAGFSVVGSSWGTSSSGGYGTGSYRWHAAGDGSKTATWTPNLPSAGTYNVRAWWKASSNRATDAKFTIYHASGNDTIVVNQQIDGNQWVYLGTYDFDAGTGGYVVLSNDANQYVIADAVAFDNGSAGGSATATNVTGDDTTYGFYVNGHNIDCLACHDAGKAHIDHVQRTYVAGVTAYGDSYRLRVPSDKPASDFCLSCHNRTEVLGSTSKTNFWNNDSYPENSHAIHLGFTSAHFDSDWDGTVDSRESCITCHNTHGSSTPAMIRDGKLIGKEPALNFSYLNSTTLVGSTGGRMNFVGPLIGQNGVCWSCHSAKSYTRDPYLGPRVMPLPVDPLANDGSGSATITVVVSDPDDNVSSVTIDLSSIGGSANQAMNNDGGGYYSYPITIPVDTPDVPLTFVITATDVDANSGEGKLTVVVVDPDCIYVDNVDATFVNGWGTSASGGYNGDYRWNAAGSGNNTATWTPNVPSTGTYNVYAWWKSSSNRATDAPFTINHAGGSATVDVNQQIGGSQWNYLGNFSFNAGAAGYVVLNDDADGYVVADCIKLCPAEPPECEEVIVDNPNAQFVGYWGSSPSGGYNGDYRWNAAGTGAHTATFTPNLVAGCTYEVYAWWKASSNRATDAPFTIHYDGGSDTVDVNQEINGDQWNLLGTYPFVAGTSGKVVLSDDADQYVVADAVRFLPVP